MVHRKILMIPGPSETHPEAIAAMAKPTLAHYGAEWGEIYRETCENLKKVFKTSGDVLILSGSGTAAMEMCVAAVVEPGCRVLNLVNGFFGERFNEVIISHGGQPVMVSADYGQAIDPSPVRERLSKEEVQEIKAMFMVYNETSTGVLNPLKEIGMVAAEFGVPLIVDVVSALGGVEVEVDAWNVAMAFASSPKCLAAPPVLGIVAVGERGWKAVEARKSPIQGFYLNLNVWKRYMREWGGWGHPYPASASTPLILGLRKAVELVLAEGLENRFKRHRVAAEATRRGVEAMGLKLLASRDVASPTMTAFWLPENVNDATFRRTVEDRYHILLGGGLGKLSGKIIRMGHMGLTANPEYVVPTLAAIEAGLRKQGFKIKLGAGVEAAQEVFQKA